MQIWAGLGNPGGKYVLHRHNVGYMAADIIGEAHGFSPAKKAFRSELREGRVGKQRILLLKPQTFMNDSGGTGWTTERGANRDYSSRPRATLSIMRRSAARSTNSPASTVSATWWNARCAC